MSQICFKDIQLIQFIDQEKAAKNVATKISCNNCTLSIYIEMSKISFIIRRGQFIDQTKKPKNTNYL